MSVAFYLLVIVSSISLSVANPVSKPSVLSILEDDAVKACIPDISIYLYKNVTEKHRTSPSKYVCPVHCAATKLGIVNEVGVNKILVQWFRDIMDWHSQDKLKIHAKTLEQIQKEKTQGDRWSNKVLIGTTMASHRVKDLCTLINDENERIRDVLIKRTNEDFQLFTYSHIFSSEIELYPAFVPSIESSPLLEAVQDADVICTGKYNVSLVEFLAMRLLSSHEIKAGKQDFCYAHCMLSELELIDENGLNKKLMDDASEVIQNFSDKTLANSINGVFRAINETVPLVASKCLHQYDETPQDYFTSSTFNDTLIPIQRAVSELH